MAGGGGIDSIPLEMMGEDSKVEREAEHVSHSSAKPLFWFNMGFDRLVRRGGEK